MATVGTITGTTLGTSSPLNLTRGFGFFPANTTIDNPSPPTIIGIGDAEGLSHTLLDIQNGIPIAGYRMGASVSGRLIIGAFFGYNLGYRVSGFTSSEGTAFLTFTEDSTRGGAGFGFGFSLSSSISVERRVGSFFGFGGIWFSRLNVSPSATIDLINILLLLLRAAGLNVPLEQVNAVGSSISSGAIWGLFGSASNEFGTRRALTLAPRFNISGNILRLIPQFRPALKAIKEAGGKLTVGPQLNILFPVTIRIARLTTVDGDYDIDPNQFPDGATLRFRGGPVGPVTADHQEFSIVHRHDIGLRFTLEIKASVSMWSLFSVSASVPIDLTSVLPVPALEISSFIGPFFTTLNNQQNLAQDDTPSQAVASELPKVVWG